MTEWSRFDLKGWQFRAFMPDTNDEAKQWTVKVTDPKGIQYAMYIPMEHDPIFGPDVSDCALLNDIVDEFIRDKGIEDD